MSHRTLVAALTLLACSKPSDNVTPTPSATSELEASAVAVATATATATATSAPPPPVPAPSLDTFPGTEAGARLLLAEFVRPGADIPNLSKQLRPTSVDYKLFYDAPTAARLDTVYTPAWESGSFVVAPRPGQTSVKVVFATYAELRAGTGKAKDLPSQYKMVAKHFVGNATVYGVHFTEPGKDVGDFYDGLLYVTGAGGKGRWILIPKPWRGLDEH